MNKNCINSVTILFCYLLTGYVLVGTHSSNGHAQSPVRIRITGRITDAETGKPLHYANIFLANTTIGTAADKNGNYEIRRVPVGSYELVASMMGYDIQVILIQILKKQNLSIHFKMKPKVIQGETVRVTAPIPRKWKRDFKKFKTLFLGTSLNATMCNIENPEVLTFFVDEMTGEFSASAEQPIQIINKGLGYSIECYIIDFVYRKKDFLRYKILPKYNQIQAKTSFQDKKWVKERLDAYKGSTRHFISALVQDKIQEEGFEMFSQNNLILNNRGEIVFNSDHLGEVNRDSLLLPGPLLSQKYFTFPKFLAVKYHFKVSLLKMEKSSVLIDLFGHLYDSYAIKKFGCWTKVRFADTLPVDYLPDKFYR